MAGEQLQGALCALEPRPACLIRFFTAVVLHRFAQVLVENMEPRICIILARQKKGARESKYTPMRPGQSSGRPRVDFGSVLPS